MEARAQRSFHRRAFGIPCHLVCGDLLQFCQNSWGTSGSVLVEIKAQTFTVSERRVILPHVADCGTRFGRSGIRFFNFAAHGRSDLASIAFAWPDNPSVFAMETAFFVS